MSKNKIPYKKGDKVKVDRSGSGKGYQFLTINESFDTDNVNGYKDYNFEELESTIKVSEYYIRHINQSDIKLKQLYDDLNISAFEIDDDKILWSFWESQKENIEKTVDYINNFLHPYLKEYNHVLPVDDISNWNSYYSKAMHTKSIYIFNIAHKVLNIVVFKTTTHAFIFVTSPFYSNKETEEKTNLGIYEISVEFSDDIYTIDIVNFVKEIISKYDKALNRKGYIYMPYVDDNTSHETTHVRELRLTGTSDDYKNEITPLYTQALKELNYIKHYIFNKGFE